MAFNFSPFSLVFFLGVVLVVVVATIAWTRRPAPGAIPFAIFLLSISVWLLARIIESGAVDFAVKVFWAKVMFLGSSSAAVMWLVFTLDYTCFNWRRKLHYIILLYAIPIITIIISNSQNQGWDWFSVHPYLGTSGDMIFWERKPIFWLLEAYLFVIVVSGIFILWRFIVYKSGLYRRQIITLLAGTVVTAIWMVIIAWGINPIQGLDLTPFVFIVVVVVYAITIFRFRFLDIVPAARGALLESMPDGILVLNSDGYIADMNPATEKIMGLNKNQALGKRLDLLWPQLDIIRSRIDHGEHTELAIEKAGSNRCFDISVTPIKDNKASITGQLLVFRDTTERRKMEQTLRESDVRYETLVEQSNEGVLIVQDGIYRFANRTMEDITGYTVNELIGKPLPFALAEEEWDMIKARYRLRMEGKYVPNIYETRGKRKDGEIRDIEISIGAITYNGQPANMITTRDITERKLTQRKLEALYKEEVRLRSSLQEEMDKRIKYTRSLIHELRTPLTSILASGELLESEVKEEILAALVKNIRRASLNLEQRIEELIELARGEIGILKINPLPLDMAELIREIVSEMAPVASTRGLSLVSEVEELGIVQGDRSRLRQVMTNLLSNAIKFTEKGKITIRAGNYDSDFLVVYVADTGRGIDKEQMEHIFDPYRRKMNSGQELSGLGIGLALSKMFIELHKGKIWVESVPGSGSTFSFTVPLVKDSQGNLMN